MIEFVWELNLLRVISFLRWFFKGEWPRKGPNRLQMKAAFSNSSILTLNYAFSTTNWRDKKCYYELSKKVLNKEIVDWMSMSDDREIEMARE